VSFGSVVEKAIKPFFRGEIMKRNWMVILFILGLTVSIFADGKSVTKYPGVTVQNLVTGTTTHGTNGVYFGPDGYLYVASNGGNEILVLDPNSGQIRRRIGPDRGVMSPDDLTFGPDGMLYFTAFFSGEVRKINPADPDAMAVTIASGLPGVNPITFSDDGRLFVALDFMGAAGIYEIDPDGVEAPKPISGNWGYWDVYNLNGFDFGPDGCLYGPILGQELVRICVQDPVPNL
jgi:DNA-binding beta-propeller fold protein YncE